MKRMRKILGFFLALCLVLPIVPQYLYAKDSSIKLEKNASEKTSKKTGEIIKKFSKSVTENKENDIERIIESKEPSYTVIVVDMSANMDEKAGEEQRKSVKNFYKSIIKANSKNQVSLIALDSITTLNTSKVICEFTNDLEKLEEAMEQNTSTFGRSFLDYGLNKSEELFDKVEEEKGRVVKNIVICSNGIPTCGEMGREKGIYSDVDNENYKYANEVYNIAKRLRENGISIYTAGFFQNLKEKELAFGKRLMKDIAGKGEYKKNNSDNNIERIVESKEPSYTVIIVDMSGDMDRAAMEKERKAVKKFYKSIIKANSKSKVSLIALDSITTLNTSKVICEFTNDLEKLEGAMEQNTSAFGRSFIDYGLNKSKELFDKVEEEKGRVVKNIVICSNGIPTGGEKETEEGLYSEGDNENYKIANEAYNVAKKLKEKGISIYTVGFFQNLEEKDLAFGERFLKDIAGKGEYKEDSNDNNNKDNNEDNNKGNEDNKTDDKDNNDNNGNSNDNKDNDHSNKDNKDNKNNNGNNQGNNNGNNNDKNSGKDNNSGGNNGNVNPDDDKKDSEDNESEHGNDEKPDYSTEDTDPIIIIPGIMGSRLYLDESCIKRVWEPNIFEKFLKAFGGDITHELCKVLYVRPCENQQKYEEGAKGIGREYGTKDTYKTLVDSICKRFPNREVYVFSYDWRKSNSISAEKLNEEIQKILQETGKVKVDIVAHSMGGLVASSYYSKYGSEKVDKIITCGTPYEGAPSLIDAVMNGNFLGKAQDSFSLNDLFDLGLLIFEGLTRSRRASFDGVTELLPTKNYVSKFPMKQNSRKEEDDLSYEEYVTEHCNRIFGKERYLSAVNFQNSILENGYNKLLNHDKSYFLVGINQKTIISVKFQKYSIYEYVRGLQERYYETDLNYSTLGDGTVPYYSASISERLSELQYYSRLKLANANHGDVVEKADCINWILDVLSGHLDGGSMICSLQNNRTAVDLSEESLAEQYYAVIRVSGPVDITTTKGNEVLSSDENNLKLKSKYGRLDLLGGKKDTKMLCLDENSDINIKLIGKDTGTMSYTIRYFDRNDKLLDERTFEISVTKDMVIRTGINKDKYTVLQLDKNKDGEVDEKISASKNENIKK